MVEPTTSITWLSLRPEAWSPLQRRPQEPGRLDLRLPEPVRGVACIAFGVGASGAAWLDRLASSQWFSGLEPQPDDLAAAGGTTPAGYLPIQAATLPQVAAGIEAALTRLPLPSARVVAVAVLAEAGRAEQETALGLVAALRARRDTHGCRMAVVVTLEGHSFMEDPFERGLIDRGAFVVRAGSDAEGDHVHHFPLRASTYPRRGRLVCVDLADYLACWRPASRAYLHVIPGTVDLARGVLDRLGPAHGGVSALNLDLHTDLEGEANPLVDLDRLALHCRKRLLKPGAENFVFTSSERLDGRTGTADLVIIGRACAD